MDREPDMREQGGDGKFIHPSAVCQGSHMPGLILSSGHTEMQRTQESP
jgi:hypothetical protein